MVLKRLLADQTFCIKTSTAKEFQTFLPKLMNYKRIFLIIYRLAVIES